jgi:hypothetical protein
VAFRGTFVQFLTWLEASGIGEWVRSSTIGYPMMIACHAIGMAIMVGLSLGLNMRLLGLFQGIPYEALTNFLAIAWAGFALNLISGTGLFATQATTYITDVTFLLKMAFVFAGMTTVAMLQSAVKRSSGNWSSAAAPDGIRLLATASIVFWVGATVTGRLIAYL